MIWSFIDSGSASGLYNMQFDIELAKRAELEKAAFFRLYMWSPYCISLGANQKFEDIKLEKAKSDGIDVVKRPTGGRAILHAEEWTYSAAFPTALGLSSQEIYRRISLALVRGLRTYDEKLIGAELENIKPDFSEALKRPSGAVCFATAAKSEVKFNGKKLIGSAQRKMNGAILQHGSLLCGNYHTKLTDYLEAENSEIEFIKEEMLGKTIDISQITGKAVDYGKLKQNLIEGFETEWKIKLSFQNAESI